MNPWAISALAHAGHAETGRGFSGIATLFPFALEEFPTAAADRSARRDMDVLEIKHQRDASS